MTLIVKPGFNGMTDADAIAYVNAVEAADEQLLEFGVGKAINDFVVGCKLDNTWNAIKASCILAGARTLAGALIPLAGTAPTNFNFVSGDYNRKTGLGNASNTTKYLNSNFLVSALGATSHALLAYGAFTRNTGDAIVLGRYDGSTSASLIAIDEWASYVNARAFRSGTFTLGEFPTNTSTAAATCIICSRVSSTNATLFVDGVSTTNTTSRSLSTAAQPLYVFALNNNSVASSFSSSKIQIYAVFNTGLTSAQAASLRANTAALITAFEVAIP